VEACREQLPGGDAAAPTFAMVFVSSRFSTEFSTVVPSLKVRTTGNRHTHTHIHRHRHKYRQTDAHVNK
jgi:hypothetical protein